MLASRIVKRLRLVLESAAGLLRRSVRSTLHRATWLTTLGLMLAIAMPLVLWKWWYTGGSIWPGLVGNFSATFAAFVIALAWERRRGEEAAGRLTDEELARRQTEARRRFATIAKELEKNEKSIAEVRQGLQGRLVLPQLLVGSWRAGSEPLGRIIADYELMADLATFYGRIEELQWRLRARVGSDYKTELDRMTSPLADELGPEVDDLLERIRRQVASPSVQALGLEHVKGMAGTITPTGTLTTEIRRAAD